MSVPFVDPPKTANRGKAPGERTVLRMQSWPEGETIEEGDILLSSGGSCYLVEEVRRSRPGSKMWGQVFCVKLDDNAVAPGDPGVKGITWSP